MSDFEDKCFHCGAEEGLNRQGGVALCSDCIGGMESDEGSDADGGGCTCDHQNPMCVCNTSEWEKAAQLSEYVDRLTESEHVEEDDLRVMPLGEEGKKPAIEGRCRLESDEADHLLYTVDEAYTALYHGADGFAIYFGRPDHGTENLLAIDRDEPDNFPDDEVPETGLKVTSGSGTFPGHLYYTHDGSVNNAQPEDIGEVRAENLYCIVPGSEHPSGGIYHVREGGEPADVTQDDIPESLQPSTAVYDSEHDTVEMEPPDELKNAAYSNEEGVPLEQVREWDDDLDDLLSSLHPSGWGTDTSRIDYHAAGRLYYWRFSRQETANILRRFRSRQKMDRQDYVDRTVENARRARTSQYTPDTDGEPTSPDPVGMLPIARLDALDQSEQRRYAKKRGLDWPDVHEVRERLAEQIESSMENGETTVVSSPTGSGKTFNVATEHWKGKPGVAGDQPVIHAHRTREARDQARQESNEADVDAFTLKGRKELCDVAAGNHDPGNEHGNTPLTIEGQPVSEWIDYRCDRQGIPFSVVHGWAESALGHELPCEAGDHACPSKSQFDGIPRSEDGEVNYDVIHCTHQFLNVPGLRLGTNIVIDEKPAFGIDISPEEVRQSVNAHLEYIDAPVDNYSQLVTAVDSRNPLDAIEGDGPDYLTPSESKARFERQMDAAIEGSNTYVECEACDGEGEFERQDQQLIGDGTSHECSECNGTGEVLEQRGNPPLTWYRDNQKAHALAPAFTRAIWNAQESAGDRKHARIPFEPPRFDNHAHDQAGWNRVYVDVVLDGQWEVVDAEMSPDFSLANSVIGLDAHPEKYDPYWMASVHPDIQTQFVLSERERALYRRYERGLFTVQVGEGIQPVASGEWLEDGQGDKFDVIVNQLADHYGERFDSAITSKAAKSHIRDAMKDAGVDEPELMHYGNEESRNDFAGKDAGLVVGSIDPGDKTVVDLCARLGLDAEPVFKDCQNCDGTGDLGDGEVCSTCNGDGRKRERGRTFEGDDSEKAEAVLRGVREHHVAQSAGRWARDASDPTDSATVYIVTEAAPRGFIDAKADGVTWVANDEQRERLEYVRDQAGGATKTEVAEACGCSKKAAYRTLRKAEEEGILEKTPGAGPYGADVYSPSESFSSMGAADVSADAGTISPDGVEETDTYTVQITTQPHCAYNSDEEGQQSWNPQSTFEWFKPPLAPPE